MAVNLVAPPVEYDDFHSVIPFYSLDLETIILSITIGCEYVRYPQRIGRYGDRGRCCITPIPFIVPYAVYEAVFAHVTANRRISNDAIRVDAYRAVPRLGHDFYGCRIQRMGTRRVVGQHRDRQSLV